MNKRVSFMYVFITKPNQAYWLWFLVGNKRFEEMNLDFSLSGAHFVQFSVKWKIRIDEKLIAQDVLI